MKTLSVLFVVALSGCMPPPTYIPRESQFLVVDFTKYTSKGFLITPEKYNGEYESIGTVRYILTPAAKMIVMKAVRSPNGTLDETKGWSVEKLSMTAALDSLYIGARSMGADAIMNFSAVEEQRDHVFTPTNRVNTSGYNLSGYAIRRKSK